VSVELIETTPVDELIVANEGAAELSCLTIEYVTVSEHVYGVVVNVGGLIVNAVFPTM